ncbi:MAG: glycosyltransferase family 4 protein [Owenweeksia sp.]|nr:glycosyltransferase family 4 protein [Owenweeksia sp.]
MVSSIYIDYSSYDRHHHHGLGRIIAAFSGKHGLEYLKTTARWVKGQEIFPGFSDLSLGQRGAIRKILTKAKKIITASTFEKELIQHDFKDVADQHFAKVNLGTEHFNTNPGQPQRAVACVARIEGLKNQYHLIKALANLDIPLHLYGQAAKHQPAYYKMCRSVSGNNISFKGYQSQKELAKLLPQYKVHALPSYYETTGLSSLEALKAGCQVVVSNRGSQPQIFGEHAHYCDPAAPTSIAEAVKKAMYTRGNHVSWVKENFSWEKSAHEILDIYNKIIHPI